MTKDTADHTETARSEPVPEDKPRLAQILVTVYDAASLLPEKAVRLRAEAQLANNDETAPTGVAVYWFLNGHPIGETVTDDFGLTNWNETVSPDVSVAGSNELAVRVKGSSLKGLATFTLGPLQPSEVLQCPNCRSYVQIARGEVGACPECGAPLNCPRGHGPLRLWRGQLRCWTCGWPDK